MFRVYCNEKPLLHLGDFSLMSNAVYIGHPQIYDGPSNQNGILAVICGSSQNLQVYTTGSSAFLEFTTDTNTVGTGFRIGWQQVDTFVTAAPPELTTGIDTTGTVCFLDAV